MQIFERLRAKAKQMKKARKQRNKGKDFKSERWAKSGDDGLAKRHYQNYEDYLNHQVAKLETIQDGLEKNRQTALADFTERFRGCAALEGARTVLCLGARLGTEVEACINLGYFAVGIDLNPGKDNSYVLTGDFHKLVFPDASVDAIYTNVLDHVFDLEKTVAEITRTLKPGGVFIADVVPGFEEGFLPGTYEAAHWPTMQHLYDRITSFSGFRLESTRSLDTAGKNIWTQAVFRKAESAAR